MLRRSLENKDWAFPGLDILDKAVERRADGIGEPGADVGRRGVVDVLNKLSTGLAAVKQLAGGLGDGNHFAGLQIEHPQQGWWPEVAGTGALPLFHRRDRHERLRQ